MSPARVIDTHRLSTLAHEYERDMLQFLHDLSAVPRDESQWTERIAREVKREPFVETCADPEGGLLTRVGAGKHSILLLAQNDAAGVVAAVYAGRLIDELGMSDDFTLWLWARSPAQHSPVRDLRPECVLLAEPTNLCIQMREAAVEGLLSESHPLVQAAIANYETLFELPPIVSHAPSLRGPNGFPAIAFGAGDEGSVRHLLKAAQFYAAFPTTYVETLRQR
jgi:hypothetical protein